MGIKFKTGIVVTNDELTIVRSFAKKHKLVVMHEKSCTYIVIGSPRNMRKFYEFIKKNNIYEATSNRELL